MTSTDASMVKKAAQNRLEIAKFQCSQSKDIQRVFIKMLELDCLSWPLSISSVELDKIMKESSSS
jgi:hypothetical protein